MRLAPAGSDAVGEADNVELPLSVEEGVDSGVPVALPVGVAVGVPEGVCVGDTLELTLRAPVCTDKAARD
jgi:hypothetical protein